MRASGGACALGLAVLAAAGPASAHHVGAYVPRDNEVSANFKQLKYALAAEKFDVAQRLFEGGAIRRELRAQGARLPAGLEASVMAALRERRAADAERALVVFVAALARDLAVEGERQVSAAGASREARATAGRRLLEAIWRYYNLVDFSISQLDPKTALAVRLAYDDAEGATKSRPEGATKGPAPSPAGARSDPGGSDPERLADPLRRIARALAGFVDVSSTARRPT